MIDIPNSDRFIELKLIERGFSGDKKYCATVKDGSKYLLRIMSASKKEAWQNLYATLEKITALNVPISKPVEFGTCSGGVYVLLTWIDGEDLADVLPRLPETEEYMLGVKAGKILKIISSIPAPADEENWAAQCKRGISGNVRKYHENDVNRFAGSENIIEFIEKNHVQLMELLEGRPQCFRHGDYSIPNMMFEAGELRIIDFDRYSFGDPWSEFFKTIFSAQISPHFTTGQVHGYFDGEPPLEFFELMALYSTYPCLTAISWAIPHGQDEVNFVFKLCTDVIKWYDNMNNVIPTWYLKGYEVWDILDADGNKTGGLHERGKAMAIGDYHLVVHVWKHNGRGEWLIDRRALNRGTSMDGKWETTGGAVLAGEDSIAAALREAKEELGLVLDAEKGTLFHHIVRHGDDGRKWFQDAWIFECNNPIEDVHFQENEVCDAMWVSAEKIRDMISTGEFLSEWFYPYLDDMLDKWSNNK